jgi:hypothetical protein
MMQLHSGTVESDLSKLLALASNPEASSKIAAQLDELGNQRKSLLALQAELGAKSRELDEQAKRLDAQAATQAETAANQAKTEQTNREVTRVLDRRQAEITVRETTQFAEREEKLKAGEAKLAQLREQIAARLAQLSNDIAAL